MAKRVIRFLVTPELLAQALNMPEGSNIMEVWRDRTYLAGDFEFIVEHDDLPEVEEGAKIAAVTPIVTTKQHETAMGGLVVTYEWDWG